MLPHFGHFEPRWAPPFPPCEELRRTWRAVVASTGNVVSRGVPKRRAHVARRRELALMLRIVSWRNTYFRQFFRMACPLQRRHVAARSFARALKSFSRHVCSLRRRVGSIRQLTRWFRALAEGGDNCAQFMIGAPAKRSELHASRPERAPKTSHFQSSALKFTKRVSPAAKNPKPSN